MKQDKGRYPHKDTAHEYAIDYSSIPQWKRDLIDIVTNLTVKRNKLKMTQEELAKRMGVKQPVVARFEHMHRMPGLEFIYRYAEALGVELKPLEFAWEYHIPTPSDEEDDFPAELFSPWKKNVYSLVTDLTVYRVKHRISQTELARRMHTSQSVITRFERMGRIPTIEFIYKIADALGVKLDGLQIREIQSPVKTSELSFEANDYFSLMEIVGRPIVPVSRYDFIQETDNPNITVSQTSKLQKDFVFEIHEASKLGIDWIAEQNSSDESEAFEDMIVTQDYSNAA